MRVAAVAAMLAVASLPAIVLAAHDTRWNDTRWDDTADGRLVDVQILVDGRTAPLYFAPGRWDRHYFQAFKGRNYAVRLRNNSGRRIGVLVNVDGLNVVNGERSGLASTEPMYVLDPYESATIRGWRTSLNDIRRFVFVDEQRSYAERTGQANGDMGWIRVLAFNERHPHVWYDERGKVREREDQPYGNRGEPESSAPRGEEGSPRAQKSAPESRYHADGNESRDGNPGTGWGDHRYDPVKRTWFVAERQATDHLVLRYEYTSGLRALGIHPRSNRNRTWERERGELGYAQPPDW